MPRLTSSRLPRPASPGRTRLRARRVFPDGSDRGAVAPLVAVLLAGGVLLGMAAFVVDLGVAYAERGQVLNAAGAAALAAAQQCVDINSTTCGLESGVQRVADANAKDNAMSIDLLCGYEQGSRNGLSACGNTGGGAATHCLSAPPGNLSYAEVHAGTRTADGKMVLPPVFSRTSDGHIAACARVAWGPPQGPYAAIGMSRCAFLALTQPAAGPGRVITTAPPFMPSPAVERVVDLQGPTVTGCDDLVYYNGGVATCMTAAGFGVDLTGSTDNATHTVTPTAACTNLIRRKEVANRADPQPYLLIPLYDSFTADPATGHATFTHIDGIAAFRVTGDKLTNNPPSGDVLDRQLGPANFCGPNTTTASRCIRGYFVWANIIDGTMPATGWLDTYGVATYKTVG